MIRKFLTQRASSQLVLNLIVDNLDAIDLDKIESLNEDLM